MSVEVLACHRFPIPNDLLNYSYQIGYVTMLGRILTFVLRRTSSSRHGCAVRFVFQIGVA
jgi:hypothetical protein